MTDFLTFKSFISIKALIIFYYLGAVILPVCTWYFVAWLVRKYELAGIMYEKGKKTFCNTLSQKTRIQIILVFIISFLFMELFWRMLFEFLIAYMQIRDVLFQSHNIY